MQVSAEECSLWSPLMASQANASPSCLGGGDQTHALTTPLIADSTKTQSDEDRNVHAVDRPPGALLPWWPLSRYSLRDDGITIGYAIASRNRLTSYDLGPGGLDVQRYMPIFVHDVMMMPGALAGLLGKPSQADILRRMTPAFIPGHRKVVHPFTGDPYLIPVYDYQARAPGMLLLGQGSRQRDITKEHYNGIDCHSRGIEVTIEIQTAIPRSLRKYANNRRTLQSRRITAEAYLPSPDIVTELATLPLRGWRLEEFITGQYMI